MGNILVINTADFSSVSLDKVTPVEIPLSKNVDFSSQQVVDYALNLSNQTIVTGNNVTSYVIPIDSIYDKIRVVASSSAIANATLVELTELPTTLSGSYSQISVGDHIVDKGDTAIINLSPEANYIVIQKTYMSNDLTPDSLEFLL